MGLYENIRDEQVRQLHLREPVVVYENSTVRLAIEQMREKNLGCAIVVNQRREPQGMMTESSLTQLLSENPAIVDGVITDAMEKDWPTVQLTDPISRVLDALETSNIRFLIVVDDNGQLAGLTGQKGLMEYVADHFPQHVIVHRIGGKPYPAEREGA